MITLIFGLPRSGKTTYFTFLAKKYCSRIGCKGSYEHVYGNVHLAVDGYTYIDNSCIGYYNLSNCLILIDEASIFADNRDYKNFSKALTSFFCLHGHYKADIILFVQKWDAVDVKIRNMTEEVFYIRKSHLFPFLSYIYRIPYGIDFVNPKTTGQKYGDIIMGYSRPSLSDRIFKSVLFRPKYYKYFDSWACPSLPELPSIYSSYSGEPLSWIDLLLLKLRNFFKR